MSAGLLCCLLTPVYCDARLSAVLQWTVRCCVVNACTQDAVRQAKAQASGAGGGSSEQDLPSVAARWVTRAVGCAQGRGNAALQGGVCAPWSAYRTQPPAAQCTALEQPWPNDASHCQCKTEGMPIVPRSASTMCLRHGRLLLFVVGLEVRRLHNSATCPLQLPDVFRTYPSPWCAPRPVVCALQVQGPAGRLRVHQPLRLPPGPAHGHGAVRPAVRGGSGHGRRGRGRRRGNRCIGGGSGARRSEGAGRKIVRGSCRGGARWVCGAAGGWRQ